MSAPTAPDNSTSWTPDAYAAELLRLAEVHERLAATAPSERGAYHRTSAQQLREMAAAVRDPSTRPEILGPRDDRPPT